MIDGSEKHNRQLAFELQNSHVCEKRSKVSLPNYHVIFDFGRPSSKGISYMVVFSFYLSCQLISANGSVGGGE